MRETLPLAREQRAWAEPVAVMDRTASAAWRTIAGLPAGAERSIVTDRRPGAEPPLVAGRQAGVEPPLAAGRQAVAERPRVGDRHAGAEP
jgi:hypothetical protein